VRWRQGRKSRNVEDRRRMRVTKKGVGGGLGAVVLALIAMYFGIDPGTFSNIGVTTDAPSSSYQTTTQGTGSDDEMANFVSVVLGDTEDTWKDLFRRMGKTYREPSLVLFSGTTESACGFAQAASGPFYCPQDQKVYIDLVFYADLKNRFKAPGDFAQAYVIAHEVVHHVQMQLGILQQVHSMSQKVGKAEANRLSVMQELQADCFAGVWAHHAHQARQILERGDIEEGLNAASSIGDDRMQMRSRGYVVPDAFTHGSSTQRVRWFRQGIETGDPNQCNTFEAGI
jgi:uncharacterized protein